MTTIDNCSHLNNKDCDNNDADLWLPSYLVDIIFVSLMEGGYDEVSKSNKYVVQIINKFKYFRIKADGKLFEISFKDLNSEALDLIAKYTKDCKDLDEKYAKLDGIIVEVISRITKQAEPAILSSYTIEFRSFIKVALNEIRETMSCRWKLVGGN